MKDITELVLNNYGGKRLNSLKHIIESQYLDQNDPNEIPDLLIPSPYYDNEQLQALLSNTNHNLNILSLNCQSLNAKYEQLKIYLNEYLNNSIDVICLQETWLNESSNINMYDIPGYKMINQTCKASSHGGLAIYLKEELTYKQLEFQSMYSNSSTENLSSIIDISESLFIEVTIPSSGNTCRERKIIIGNVYRPPRDTNEYYSIFTNHINEILDYFARGNKEVIITGDFNIDLLRINEKIAFGEFLETILANSFLPAIVFPTRFIDKKRFAN